MLLPVLSQIVYSEWPIHLICDSIVEDCEGECEYLGDLGWNRGRCAFECPRFGEPNEQCLEVEDCKLVEI